jgi:DNA repair exonuclease SbcCD ATPase subunit
VHFRNWPNIKLFDSLGTVNLLVGSNGVGKTTLLEAIEFVYCKANARVEAPASAHIRVKLKDAPKWIDVKASGKTDEAKQRNLDWYGQRDLRGSTLSNSFARFNFLATDNAAILGQRGTKLDFEETLSRLVAGPQTATLWDHISRLVQPLATELSRVQTGLEEAVKRKAVIEALIKSEAAAPRASDSDFTALAEDLSRLGWRGEVTKENIASTIAPALARASSVVRELQAANSHLDAMTPSAVAKTLTSANSAFEDTEARVAEINDLEGKMRSVASAKDVILKTVEDIKDVERACQAGAFDASADFERLEKEVSNLRREVGSEPMPLDDSSWLAYTQGSLDEQLSSARVQAGALEREMSKLNRDLVSARDRQQSTDSIIAELRTLTKHLLQTDPDHKDCPVCSTKFDAGELLNRLDTIATGAGVNRVVPIVEALEVAKQGYTQTDANRRALADLQAYASRRMLSSAKMSADEVFADYKTQHAAFGQLQDRLAGLTQQLATLALSGLDRGRVATLRQLALTAGIGNLVEAEIRAERGKRTAEIADLDTELLRLTSERDRVVSALSLAIMGTRDTTVSAAQLLGTARSQRTRLQNVQSLINQIRRLLELGDDDDLATVTPRIDSAREAAERFAAAINGEATSRSTEAKAKADLEQIEKHIEEYELIRKRVTAALEQITELRKNEALADATDAELMNVQVTTDSVFRKIHSPHEYGVRRDAQAPLYRLDDPGKDITLSDISTGQRAAFVLSVFLAMNSKLQDAPPVLLFDDPVAHIDDFNSLSFLDYLRDVALAGNRQIFYATADAKLAGLFEHKFSFLGEKFRRFDLSR